MAMSTVAVLAAGHIGRGIIGGWVPTMERLDDEEEVHMSLTTETDDDDVSGMMSVDEDDMMIMELRQAVVLCDEAVEEAMILSPRSGRKAINDCGCGVLVHGDDKQYCLPGTVLTFWSLRSQYFDALWHWV
jgi:hypothetical protein